MTLPLDHIARDVYNALELVAREFLVLKYVVSPAANPYRQRTKQYDAGTEVRGHIVYKPSPEVLSVIGADVTAEGVITISRLHLLAAFPGIDPALAISDDDQLVVDGTRWRVVKTHRTAPLGRGPEIFYLAFDFLLGRKAEAFP